ncbi:MAG: hypothetical protein JWS10_136 [Cypionkella sp.]|uniref:CGNR zinc finger domain-containing protein n=1 Tax=Cypionkella sp. TaxID=2811411 RepID=UPI002617DDD3|nr:CGNR zinc finger domain-containing protein [Cypionkella sp.]MDB5657521.1 hypothetical protein [Cypionkella sp.]
MASKKTIADIALLGGHTVLDFINTVDARRDTWGPDFLTCYSDLLLWAERVGLFGQAAAESAARLAHLDPAAGMTALDRAKVLREALYGLCQAETSKAPITPEDLGHLNRAVRQAEKRRHLGISPEGLEWQWQATVDLDLVTDRLALAAAALLVEDKSGRRSIRECPGQNCGWLFLDTSRGGRRHWCSEKGCGTRTRVRKFRAQ